MRASAFTASVALFVLWPATAASAQDRAADAAPAATATTQIQDIVVTAQRRSERLQDVPIAVSAVSATALQNSGITGLDTLQVSVPSLSAQNAAGFATMHLRGVGSSGNGAGFENPIALYIDGVYIANQSVGLAQFNNVERIEVLKGPQGTLFGRNATGGLVQIITRDPSKGMLVNGGLSYGNYNAFGGQLYAGGPLNDRLAADVAVRFDRHDGWGTNLTTGRDVYALKHDVAVRSKIVYDAGPATFTLIGDYSDRSASDNATTDTPGSRPLPGVAPASYPKPWDVRTNVDPSIRIKGGGVSLKAVAPIGTLELMNLAAYRETSLFDRFDYDGSPFPLVSVQIQQRDRQFSDELQLSSGSGDRLTWVTGLYYFRASGRLRPSTIGFASTPLFNPSFPLGSLDVFGVQRTEALSGYAQATYKLADRLSVTGGVRYSWEKRTLDANQNGNLLLPGNPVIPIVPEISKSRSTRKPTFRASIDYKATPDILVYASFNTGFKSGGFNVTTPTDPAYKEESLKAWEIGEKAYLFGRALRLNSAVFLYDYKNIQVQISQATGTGFTNGASARIYGFDGEATLRLSTALELNGGLTLLHPTFRNFPNAPVSTRGGGVPVGFGDVSGNDLNYAARTTFSLGGTYSKTFDNVKLVTNATWLHSSHYFFEPDNVEREPAFDTVNASATLSFDDERLSIGVFGNNLTNKAVRNIILTQPAGFVEQIMQAPRTYGVRLGFKFGS